MKPSSLPRNEILVGDVRTLLSDLSTASIDCIITSPPYFGLRNYGHPAQIGLEPDVTAWVDEIRQVCRQLARVLTPTGACWLNLGDGYSAAIREGTSPKSLLLAPQRLSLALVEDGWLIRNQVIWHKPNGMPHSVRDRLTNRYEVMLLLVRQRDYYFDLDAIRMPAESPASKTRDKLGLAYPPLSAVPRGAVSTNHGLRTVHVHPLGKNPGDVWPLATAGFRGSHFATFPTSLIHRPLLATCPAKICVGCRKPWKRAPVDRSRSPASMGDLAPGCDCRAGTRPGVVLDPFMGTGTVAVVAEQHERSWIGIELNPEFARLAQERIARAREGPTNNAA